MISSPPTSEQCVSTQSSPPREFWGLWCETHHRPSSECREIEKDALLAASNERIEELERLVHRRFTASEERCNGMAIAAEQYRIRAETAEASLKEALLAAERERLERSNFEWSAAIGIEQSRAETAEASLKEATRLLIDHQEGVAMDERWDPLTGGYPIWFPEWSLRRDAFLLRQKKEVP